MQHQSEVYLQSDEAAVLGSLPDMDEPPLECNTWEAFCVIKGYVI